MKYQTIINLLDNASKQSSKFRTKNWFEINHQSRGVYNTKSEIIQKHLEAFGNITEMSQMIN